MRKSFSPLVLLMFVAGCGSSPTAPPPPPQVVFVPTPTPTATPTPRPTTLVGFWKVANTDGTNAWFNGYGIDITSHTGSEIRGRSIYPFDDVTGLLIGTVKTDGKVEWQTRYSNGTENGSFQLDASGRMLGNVFYELSTGTYSYRNVLLTRQ